MAFIKTLSVLAIIATATFGAMAPAAAVDLLGCRKVNFGVDRDFIPVGKAAGRYSSIQLAVTQNPIELFDLNVVYGNGNPDNLAVRTLIPAGGRTRWIDLKGARRFIRRVDVTYRSIPAFVGRATVCAYGR